MPIWTNAILNVEAAMNDRRKTSSDTAISNPDGGDVESAMKELMPELGRQGDTLSLLKVVFVGILVSLTLKVLAFILFDRAHALLPVVDTFFPAFFRCQTVARCAYLLSCSGCLLGIFARQQKHLVIAALVVMVNSAVLAIHQSGYNDVTFMCCCWAALWCVWVATRLNEPFATLFPRAVWLSHVILSLIFLGGAVGKVTAGYWSGQVLYDIYFQHRDFWFYNLVRASLSAEQLPAAAMWHSRMVIITEFVCGFLWLMPAKVASAIAVVVLCGIALTNNFLLFSVVTCLISLAIVGLHQPKSAEDRKAFAD
jgi:hypothetical protein